MLTGKEFKIKTSTLAIDTTGGKRVAIYVPAGSLLKIVAGPADGSSMVDILWKSQTLVMFAIDLQRRGDEVKSQSASA